MAGAVTVSAIDVLARPATSHPARIAKITAFPSPHTAATKAARLV
ncbi:hypothetical protein [Streptomyces sp. NRRL S-340]|nr:hypothetical protein [Streptomyces sp. NRRL S-340]